MSNEFEVVIRLPKSDGFHTKGDLHLAQIVQDGITRFLADELPALRPGGATVIVREVRAERGGAV
jgi:hypothetical protein